MHKSGTVSALLLSILLFSALIFSESNHLSVARPASLYVNARAQDKVVGISPALVRRAYGFDQVNNRGGGQTIAIIVALDHPNIESDLRVFSETFGLPACTKAGGCLQVIYANSPTPPVPDPDLPSSVLELWQLESAVDVEWAHAIAPEARIMLVEAQAPTRNALLDAVRVAIDNNADVISMSWGVPEFEGQTSFDRIFLADAAFVASAGDTGHPGLWPATSPAVTAVGGSKLHTNSAGNYSGETAWAGSGGGTSLFELRPSYQAGFNTSTQRGIPDVAYNADPNTGFAVFSSIPFFGSVGWFQVGGTSPGAPQWAALIAIANSLRLEKGKLPLGHSLPGNFFLYGAAASGYSSNYHDITGGPKNGKCGPTCSPKPGYDYVTGLGSPQANNLIHFLASAP